MAKALNHIHICPACGSEHTNKVSLQNNYCMDCGIEFDIKSKKVYTILFDGSLVDNYANEFANCG